MNEKSRLKTFLLTQQPVLLSLVLVLVTTLIYLPTGKFGFFYYDDPAYITENPNVRNGLTAGAVAWAFSARHAGNWHPLTWISHMADVQFYGLNPGAHHLTNLIFHTLNALLLFLVLRKMTGAMWQSVFVAALFAVHPLHVESVAWIAERKDVLSTFFWMLTLLAYEWYVKRPDCRRYIPVLLFFVLGLMSKPMVVTLPFVLLLLDFWPLRRFSFRGFNEKCKPENRYKNMMLFWEKVPLFVFSAALSIITILAQKEGDTIRSLHQFPFPARIANALAAYIMYISKLIWPDKLAFMYPYPDTIPLWRTIGAVLLLIFLCVLAVKFARQYPYVTVGWYWYIGTLVPVIGLVQVGVQAMADRYTYIPSIGLFMAIVWGVSAVSARWRYKSTVMATVGLGIVVFLMGGTSKQIAHWHDSKTLFRHTLSVTDNNYVIHLGLADILSEQGCLDDAIEHYRNALRIKPDLAEAHNNLGVALGRKKDFFLAIKHYREAILLNPNYPIAESNLGNIFLHLGQTGEALKHYDRSLSYDSNSAGTHNSLGLALLRMGKIDRAVHHFEQAVRLDPFNAALQRNLNLAASFQKKIDVRLDDLAVALQANPEMIDMNNYVILVEKKKRDLDGIIHQYIKALTLQPGFTPAEFNINNYFRASEILKTYNHLLPQYKNK